MTGRVDQDSGYRRFDGAASPASDEHARDLAWLRSAAQGDRAAFQRLYLHHHPRLARFLHRNTARRELVDEIINEAMWVVWRNAADFRGESRVSTWIIGIAYRCLLKALRGQTAPRAESAEAFALRVEDASADASESDRHEVREWVQRGLLLLPTEQRVTIELAYFLGQSCEEIAAIMNVAVGTVKARMFHARVRLRNTLPALAGDAPPNVSDAGGDVR